MGGKRRSHCYHGHEYTPENTYTSKTGDRTCRTCKLESARKWRAKPGMRKKRTEDEKERRRDPLVKKRVFEIVRLKRYKLTPEGYYELLEDQGSKCPICRTELRLDFGSDNRRGDGPTVDHDHKCCPGEDTCGKCTRGILCSSCNKGIAYLKDNPINMIRAAQYVQNNLTTRPPEQQCLF